MEIAPRINVDYNIRFGKPVITGTRVTIDLILDKLAGGMTYRNVIKFIATTMTILKILLKCLSVYLEF